MFRRSSTIVLRARAHRLSDANFTGSLPKGFVPRPGSGLPKNLREIEEVVLPGVHVALPTGEKGNVGIGGHAICTHAQSRVGTLVEIGERGMMIPKVRVERSENGIFIVRKDTHDNRAAIRRVREELMEMCERLARADSEFAVKWSQALARCDARDLHWMPDALATMLEVSDEEKIKMLEEPGLVGRARMVIDLIKSRNEGEKTRDDIDQLIDLGAKIPHDMTRVRWAFDREVKRLRQLEPSSQEYAANRQYLDLLLSLPRERSRKITDLKTVRKKLSETHYGLEEVKERVVEVCALEMISSTPGRVRPILLVGPPGCGKTTIARSIAEAIGRRFEVVSLGGLSDAGELKGHRRTYIGSQAGKLVNAFISSGRVNPVILLDEIDKLGGGAHSMGGGGMGDPASALLDALDCGSAGGFTDNFIEVPIDLSGVLFIGTANSVEEVPAALANRFDVVRIAGFVNKEKIAIGRKYIIPECEKACNIGKDTLVIEECALERIATSYCRELGVREMQTNLWRIFRRAVVRLCEGENELPMRVSGGNVSDWLGLPTYPGNQVARLDRARRDSRAVGLGWTEAGGAVLDVECLPSTDWLITGQVGTTLQETIRVAASWAKVSTPMHVNIGPDMSARKDGPSLGLAVAALFWAHQRGQALPGDVGFTGAITLGGEVHRVGGIREKIVAASLEGVRVVVLPRGNERDWSEIAGELREGVEAIFVESLDDLTLLLDGWHQEHLLGEGSFRYEI